jgi:hypothetical protein
VHVEAALSVGEALAEARGSAGLSVDEVSERTAIREIVIRSIERDDFDSLGGDLYVRGYLRKIAGAVGIDPRPLIREFDSTRSNGSGGWSALGTSGATAAATGPATGSVPAHAVSDSPVDGSGHAAGEPGEGSDAVATGVGDAEAASLPTAALDTGAEPEAAVESASPPESADATWDETPAEPRVDAELAGTGLQPATAEAALGESDDAAAEEYWAEPGSAASASTDQSWWTEPVAAEEVWADPTPLESAGTPATATGETMSVTSPGASASSAGRNAAGSHPGPTARSARRPGKSRRPQPRTRVRGRRWVATISGFTIVVLAIVGVASGEIVSKLGSPKSPAAASRSVPTAAPSATAAPATPAPASPAAVRSTPASKPRPTSSVRPPAAAPARPLAVQADGAFGPDGLADGDNPQSASFAITSDASAPWQTDWYTTADFGLLKHGTGLLLDMGKRVTITSVTIQLGDNWGADLQLRAGDEADLSEMPVVASVTDTGGQLTMRLKQPARARYVLIWFVKLAPSGVGTYTASVYSVKVEGRP